MLREVEQAELDGQRELAELRRATRRSAARRRCGASGWRRRTRTAPPSSARRSASGSRRRRRRPSSGECAALPRAAQAGAVATATRKPFQLHSLEFLPLPVRAGPPRAGLLSLSETRRRIQLRRPRRQRQRSVGCRQRLLPLHQLLPPLLEGRGARRPPVAPPTARRASIDAGSASRGSGSARADGLRGCGGGGDAAGGGARGGSGRERGGARGDRVGAAAEAATGTPTGTPGHPQSERRRTDPRASAARHRVPAAWRGAAATSSPPLAATASAPPASASRASRRSARLKRRPQASRQRGAATRPKSTSRMADGHETDAGDVHSGRCAR